MEKNPSAKANDSKVYLFPEEEHMRRRREATERSREKKVSNDFQSNAYPPTILLFGCNLSPCYCHAAQLLLLSSTVDGIPAFPREEGIRAAGKFPRGFQ